MNRFSNAARASFGRKFEGVEVSFSRVTRISYDGHSFFSSFFAIRTVTGCMHSNRLPGSKYMHCLHECSSKPHFGQRPSTPIPCSTVPHWAHRDTARVPGRFTGFGPSAWSHLGGPLVRSGGAFRGSCLPESLSLGSLSLDSRSRSWYPCCRYFATKPSQAGKHCLAESPCAQVSSPNTGRCACGAYDSLLLSSD